MESQPEKPKASIWVKDRQVPKPIVKMIGWFIVAWCVCRFFTGLNLLTMSISERGRFSEQYFDLYTETEEFFDAKVVYPLWSPNIGSAYFANTSDSKSMLVWYFPHWEYAGEATKESGVWMHLGEPVFDPPENRRSFPGLPP